jgi:hypothetical protein
MDHGCQKCKCNEVEILSSNFFKTFWKKNGKKIIDVAKTAGKLYANSHGIPLSDLELINKLKEYAKKYFSNNKDKVLKLCIKENKEKSDLFNIPDNLLFKI